MAVIAVVIAGGPLAVPWSDVSPPFDRIVAVDGGLDVALAAGLEPTVLLGDLDSVSTCALRWAEDHRLPVVRHPADKDDTDTALALAEVARVADPAGTDLVVLGSSAVDRFDHLLGTLLALGAPDLAALRSVTAHLGATEVRVLHPHRRCALALAPERTLSLLALHGRCTGVHISGVRWPLADHALTPTSTLGVSNEAIAGVVEVSVGDGVLTVVLPPVADTHGGAA